VGSIAGSFVLDGKVNRNASARIMRDGEQIFEGKISTLKRFKDDVREVSNGYECGIAVEGYKDIQEGDILEVIEYTEIRRSID
jgi:translation initiation factor IF-2